VDLGKKKNGEKSQTYLGWDAPKNRGFLTNTPPKRKRKVEKKKKPYPPARLLLAPASDYLTRGGKVDAPEGKKRMTNKKRTKAATTQGAARSRQRF